MIQNIVGQTIYDRCSALRWKHQIGYMVTRHNHRTEGPNGQFVDHFIPIAPYVEVPDCESPTYGILVPDQRYRSLILIEAASGISFEPNPAIANRQGVDFEFDVAVKVWINRPLISIRNLTGDGESATDIGSEYWFMTDMIKALHGLRYKSLQVPLIIEDVAYGSHTYTIPKVKINLVRELERTPQAVFGQYSFSNDQALFKHDYMFFGLVFRVSGTTTMACIGGLRNNALEPAC